MKAAEEQLGQLPPSAVVGRHLRTSTPRSRHGEWRALATRTDPLEILRAQEQTRVAELIPIRHERMSASPFAFFRGAAAIMAADLLNSPSTGLTVQLCGDAHIANFGAFASPERRLVFYINDFDETLAGPWEWDVKRFVTSIEVAARDRGFSPEERRAAVLQAASAYRQAMTSFADMTPLQIWSASYDVVSLLPQIQRELGDAALKETERVIEHAESKDSARAARKLTHIVDGRVRILSDPPLIVPLDQLLPDVEAHQLEEGIREALANYRLTLSPDRQILFDRYEFEDIARKVVGVGSVGTLSWIVLFLGREHGDPLVLQLKQAENSVLEPVLEPSPYENHGERVVEGQRLIQASSDVLLGWLRTKGLDGVERDFYVRQLWDWKTSSDLASFAAPGLTTHGRLCAWTLARAHARTGNPVAMASYMGSGRSFDNALAAFADAYADQNERDFDAFTAAAVRNSERPADHDPGAH